MLLGSCVLFFLSILAVGGFDGENARKQEGGKAQ